MAKKEYERGRDDNPNLIEFVASLRGVCSWCVFNLICGSEVSVSQEGKAEEKSMKFVVSVDGNMAGKTGCGLD
ncbi:hypothetical protein A3B57_01910 [Microgenomates group bacterium RIFCSPLOWO2_01_FULL_47_10]|nr:MAG: hypothetical protein A3B57_01910 [Microgenomates group bacterium RIFCSPLOWO2_01_FULL_47_10]